MQLPEGVGVELGVVPGADCLFMPLPRRELIDLLPHLQSSVPIASPAER
jgi:hypothetical protein